MYVRRPDHVAAIAIGCAFLFLGALATLFSAEVTITRADFFEGNQNCSSPENGMCTYGYMCEDGKKGVIGKPCEDIGKASGKKVSGICVRPGVCEAKTYDGEEVKKRTSRLSCRKKIHNNQSKKLLSTQAKQEM